jgi:N-acetylmuramic acid 6-phosphate etherase
MDDRLPLTESVNPSTTGLDTLGTADLLQRINDEDRRAAWAVEREIDVLATAVDQIVERLRAGGTLHYFGAGTSGRVAAADAAEMEPTFSAGDLVFAHIAGGPEALTRSIEAAEDDEGAGVRDASALTARDAAIGISASGGATYVAGALEEARRRGALTIALTNSPGTALADGADIAVVLRTGPEVVAGSTRMKAAAAQKMALGMLSTAVMVKLGKVFDNLMVDLRPTNRKLRERAVRLTQAVTGASSEAVRDALEACHYRPKVAIVMLARACDVAEAERRLDGAGGELRSALVAQ